MRGAPLEGQARGHLPGDPERPIRKEPVPPNSAGSSVYGDCDFDRALAVAWHLRELPQN